MTRNIMYRLMFGITIMSFVTMICCFSGLQQNDPEKFMAACPSGTEIAVLTYDNARRNHYGWLKDGSTTVSVDNGDKLFEIGSLTKLFASYCALRLQEEKVISLEESITNNRVVSLEDLIYHLSGLPRSLVAYQEQLNISSVEKYDFETSNFLEEILVILEKVDQKNVFRYSNLGYQTLGALLAERTKTSFSDLVKKYILDPQELDQTYFFSKENNNAQMLVPGRYKDGKIIENTINSDYLYSAGSMISSVNDLSVFIEHCYESKFFFDEENTVWIADDQGINWGWQVNLTSQRRENYYYHNGGTLGYSSFVIASNKQKKFVVILSNLSVMHPKHQELDQLALAFFNKL